MNKNIIGEKMDLIFTIFFVLGISVVYLLKTISFQENFVNAAIIVTQLAVIIKIKIAKKFPKILEVFVVIVCGLIAFLGMIESRYFEGISYAISAASIIITFVYVHKEYVEKLREEEVK